MRPFTPGLVADNSLAQQLATSEGVESFSIVPVRN